jgi:predicted ribosomally synthesized peptide with SipW-like signal peptide
MASDQTPDNHQKEEPMAQLDLDMGGDYVPASPGRKKVSRARKSLIGLLLVGAIGAIAGGGTFASFTASTDYG